MEATEKRLAQIPSKDDRDNDQMDFESVVDDAFLAFLDILNQSTIAELAGDGKPQTTPAARPALRPPNSLP